MENVYFLYELNLHGKRSHLNHLWRWTVMTSVTETSNRFISLLWRPINCNSSRASHLSHSKHSGGIPSSAASLSNPPLQEASIFGGNCERAPVQMLCQANTCSQYKSPGSNYPTSCMSPMLLQTSVPLAFFLGAERRCSVSPQRRLWPLLLIHYSKWDHLAVIVRWDLLGVSNKDL